VVWPKAAHRLGADFLVALGSGEFSAQIIRSLRATELSKHFLMLEALRRRTGARLVQTAFNILSDVQERAPEVVDELVGSPQLGFWAADCLSRLPTATGQPHGSPRPSSADLAHLSAFAAAAALRIGYPFELPIPVRRGVVTLPTLGAARLAPTQHSGWARIRLDRSGATVRSAFRIVRLPLAAGLGHQPADPAWMPATWLTTKAAGINLRVVLDTTDPFLARLSPQMATDVHPHGAMWQERIDMAWRLLAEHHRQVADQLAASVTTLVPLRPPTTGDVVAATSGWAWGAIWLNLPASNVRLAETLVHEFHHLVLAAAEELAPLVREGDDRMFYVPWRDDPRPSSAVLQGTYAQLGVAGFWQRQRGVESGGTRFRADVEFARARQAALRGIRSLGDAGVLTEAGQALVEPMLIRLEEWQHEPVRADAESAAAEIADEHRLRWRLAHVRPPTASVDAAAHAWLFGEPKMPVGPQDSSAVSPFTRHISADLAHLLEISYRDPPALGRILAGAGASSAEGALVSGHYADAKDGYVRRIQAGEDGAAWIGLLLALRHLAGSAKPVTWQPEILAAVYDRILEITNVRPDPETLIAWLTFRPGQLSVHRPDIEVQAAALDSSA
jgi:HEXXH motif-containing protein